MVQPDFFSNVIDPDTTFFDEGPSVVRRTSTVFSSSIDTTLIDAYRQGVEITTEKHYTLGIVKIHSGEPGHTSVKLNFGQDESFSSTFEPYSEPTSIDDAVDNSHLIPNGVLEPLATIRPLLKPLRTVNGVHGMVQDGNENDAGSDAITSGGKRLSTYVEPYVDRFSLNVITANNGTTSYGISSVTQTNVIDYASFEPFVDEIELDLSSIIDSGSLSTYVSYHMTASLIEIGSTSGFVYDGQPHVVDSLAFGGMTF